jgi:6-phosphogluconolactonase (cycloisomerase 2 family)
MSGSSTFMRHAPILTAIVIAVSAAVDPMSTSASADAAALYASVGTLITHYAVDADHAALTKRESITVPASVQYAWRHPSGRYLYVVWSDGATGTRHGVSAFEIEAGTGALKPHGAAVPLEHRPIHVTTDRDGAYLLIAYNIPPTVTVHHLEKDGSIGAAVPQKAALHFGIYLHQVRVEPSTGTVFVVARGNYAEDAKTTDSGEVDVFDFKDGQLSNRRTVAPGGGVGFNPRHLDFHPSKQWIFVSLEPQNQLQTYEQMADGSLDNTPLFTTASLTNPASVKIAHRQLAGTVHVHPNGRFVYQANRGTGTTLAEGKRVWAGGSNSIAVFRINEASGEPTLTQNADTHGLVPRTFSLDPSARVLVAANQNDMLVHGEGGLEHVPASLATFRVRGDGMLDYVSKLDIGPDQGTNMFWMAILPVPR